MTLIIPQAADVVAAIAFIVALVLVLLTPSDPARGLSRWTKLLFAASLFVFVATTAADAAGGMRIGDRGEVLEDYLETLFPLLVVGGTFAAFAAQQYADIVAAQKALAQSHELTMQIVDGAPSGILFLDASGRVAFANETAEELLGIGEHLDTGAPVAPGLHVIGPDGRRAEDFSALLSEEPYRGRMVTVELPSGARVDLDASGRPLRDPAKRIGGIVVTLWPAETRLQC